MFTGNPFADLLATIPAFAMQAYVIAMVFLVIGGTLFDVMHKKSARYFFENSKKAQKSAKRTVNGGEKASLAVKTVANEVLTSAEFANPQRRMSHLLTMYGFIIFVVTSAMLIFSLPAASATAVAVLWHVGAAMVCVGGYWFWFAIRVDVSAEGYPWYRIAKADMFIVSLLLTTTFALVWSFLGLESTAGWLAFFAFVASATFLFSTVLWSKFAHMFFKPAAALQKRVAHADGSAENLPADYDLSDPATHAKFPDIPEYMGANPPNMGLGIKREKPRHY